MRRLLNSFLVSAVCLCLLAVVPAIAYGDDLNDATDKAPGAQAAKLMGTEDGDVQLHIEKTCTTDPADIKAGAELEYQLTVWAEDKTALPGGQDLTTTFVEDTLGSGLTLTSADDVIISGGSFKGSVTASGDGFRADIWTDNWDDDWSINTDDGQCIITYRATLTADAKAGDTFINTASFGAFGFEDVTATETVTVAGEPPVNPPEEQQADDPPADNPVNPDDSNIDNTDNIDKADNADNADKAVAEDYSPPTGDSFLETLLKLFPFLRILFI